MQAELFAFERSFAGQDAMKKIKALLSLLPIVLISALLLLHNFSLHSYHGAAALLVFFYVLFLFYNMLRTGNTWKWRAMLFIPAAVLFPLGFIYRNIMERGSWLVSSSAIYECKVPFCHLVIPSIIIPGFATGEVPFPGSMQGGYASIASMLVILVSAAIVLGRGWCAWGCFYGGWDEGFSLLRKKPAQYLTSVLWCALPWAVLISTALLAAYTLTPAYCSWLCPFKAVTEFRISSAADDIIAMVIFFAVFLAFVVILPVRTGKRTQCSAFCPLGPTLLAACNRVNIFAVKIDKNKCIGCKKCINVCPLNAIDEEGLLAGHVRKECAKCGKCIDYCPSKAISYHIRGTSRKASPQIARLLFVYAAATLMIAMLGTILTSSLAVLFKIVFG